MTPHQAAFLRLAQDDQAPQVFPDHRARAMVFHVVLRENAIPHQFQSCVVQNLYVSAHNSIATQYAVQIDGKTFDLQGEEIPVAFDAHLRAILSEAYRVGPVLASFGNSGNEPVQTQNYRAEVKALSTLVAAALLEHATSPTPRTSASPRL